MSDDLDNVRYAAQVWQPEKWGLHLPWRVDGNGYLLTPSGAKVARVANGCVMLFDKRTHEEVPLTLADFYTVTQTEL
jgi:hypothetical protein